MNSVYIRQKILLLTHNKDFTGALSSEIVDSVWDMLKDVSHSLSVSPTSSFCVSSVSVPSVSGWEQLHLQKVWLSVWVAGATIALFLLLSWVPKMP